MFFIAGELAASLLMLGDYGGALTEADHAIARRRGYWFPYVIKVNALVRLDRLAEAKAGARRPLRHQGRFPPRFHPLVAVRRSEKHPVSGGWIEPRRRLTRPEITASNGTELPMPQVKYFAGIEAAQQATAAAGPAPLAPFDFNVLAETSVLARVKSAITGALLPPIYAFSRAFMPILPLAGILHVTRDAQVREILLRPDDFHTPFGPEMAELGDGATFLLGLDGPEHDRLHAILAQVIRRDDGEMVAALATRFATALLDNSKGRIDVIGDLLKRVPAEICLRYFGLKYDDVDALGDWTMAISALLFGDPFGDPATRTLALERHAAAALVIDDALARTQMLCRQGRLTGDGDTLIERLVLLQQKQPVTDAEIRAALIGLATGFIPTNTLAATRMLTVLLARPDAMAMARAAALADDLPAMRRIVLEAGRLSPALSPGQWRYCPRNTTVTVDGRARTIKAGSTLIVSTMSAMRDRRAISDPGSFRPDRTGPDGEWHEPDLVFGIGPHSCMGKHLAIEQISALFTVLLKQPGLTPAKGKPGRMQWTGPFPRHLEMTFDTPASQQSMFLIIARVGAGVTKAEIDAQLAPFGNPDRGRRCARRSTRLGSCTFRRSPPSRMRRESTSSGS